MKMMMNHSIDSIDSIVGPIFRDFFFVLDENLCHLASFAGSKAHCGPSIVQLLMFNTIASGERKWRDLPSWFLYLQLGSFFCREHSWSNVGGGFYEFCELHEWAQHTIKTNWGLCSPDFEGKTESKRGSINQSINQSINLNQTESN